MKIATLNLRHNQDRWEERFPLVVETLCREQADVVGLQEVYLPIRQAHRIAEAVNAREPAQPYAVYVEPKWGPQPIEGVAILSRLPILERERLELPEGERVAQRITVEADGQQVHIANTHLHHRPIEDESIRLPQMQALLDWMFSRAESGWLLTGDMNALPQSATVEAAAARLQSAYFTFHQQHPITFPTPLVADHWGGPDLCIDYIFFDASRLQVQQVQRIADQAHTDDPKLYPSDHFGLAAEVTISA